MLQGVEVFMAEQLFDVSKVGPASAQFGGTTTAQGVRGDRGGRPEWIGVRVEAFRRGVI